MSYYEYFRDKPVSNVDVFVHNFHWEQHVHKSLELQYCTGESIDVDLGGNKYRIGHGEVLVIVSGMPHAMADRGDNYAMLVPPRFLDVWFESVGDASPADPVIRGAAATEIGKLMLGLRAYLSATPVKLHVKLYEILEKCFDNLAFVSAQKPAIDRESYDIISKCIQYIDLHYKDDITLGTLASEFGYNKNYLSDILHKEFDMNFRDFLNQRRLEMFTTCFDPAQSLEIQWEKFGFNSRQTFYRAFKKQFKSTPSTYLAATGQQQ